MMELSRQILALELTIDLNVESYIDLEGYIRERRIAWETRALIEACNTLRGLKGAPAARSLEQRCEDYLREWDAARGKCPPGG